MALTLAPAFVKAPPAALPVRRRRSVERHEARVYSNANCERPGGLSLDCSASGVLSINGCRCSLAHGRENAHDLGAYCLDGPPGMAVNGVCQHVQLRRNCNLRACVAKRFK
jgi:hypothetical protein